MNQTETFWATGRRELEPNRRTIVFVHGAAQDHTIWVLPRRYFVRHGYNVLDLDLPGHGYSAGPALTTVEAMADWVMRGVEGLGVTQVALVGHSLGSLVALDAAARYPAEISRIALVGTAVPMPVGDVLMDAAQHHPQDAFEMMNTWSHSDAAQMGGNATPGIWMMENGLRLFEKFFAFFKNLAISSSRCIFCWPEPPAQLESAVPLP